ncbi:PP2C family protein-serine/threonine phosphatase [Treponema sp.]|uniref:PP2C family protein-serine/threonine phosphatase n=1 Tax=Treponema sp. TaxID=166 RepID=UPI00298D987E|nr:PP2C family protein-serine/threonine phosphatase [Treponema sp.]MCQ2241628.1 serine/threonine-protein phosphatase [Treponema sp.]
MVYALINFLIGVILVFQSFRVDRQSTKYQSSSSLVNLILFSSASFFCMALTVFLTLKGTKQFALIGGRLTYFLFGWLAVSSCDYILKYPEYKRTRFMKLMRFILLVGAGYFAFFAPNGLNSFEYTDNGFEIVSGLFVVSKLGSSLWITRLDAFYLLYMGLFPAFVSLMVLVRAEHTKAKLIRQNMINSVIGFVLSWITFWFIKESSNYMYHITALTPVGFLPQLYFFIRSNENDEVVDFRGVVRGFLRFLIEFLIPVCIIGAAYILLAPYNEIYLYLYPVLLFCVVTVVVGLVTFFRKRFGNSELFRKKRYAQSFEKDISSLDFAKNPQEITDEVYKIFKKYLGTSSMRIVMDDGTGNISVVYSSDGNTNINIPFESATGDAIMNAHRQVIFKEQVTRHGSLAAVKSKLEILFRETNSDALVMLNEGRNFIGLILLGPKTSGNIYSDYDYDVFNKYYSNLFVVGYYIKNIMNESVVGTVNREIRMSGQIITSIQENMDLIQSKKVDAGYLMIPAHNIGGEFVDMIRLTDTRHIFIIGALSGKGIAASMSMVILKSIIRTYLAETTDFKKLVAKVNVFIRDSLPKGTFFAGIFGLLDFTSDTLYYINCGSPALYVYTRAYNNVIEVQGEGHILGFVKDISPLLKVKKVKLAEGDIIMSVTDGILDTKSLRGDIFGKQRTQNALMDNSTYPAEKMTKFAYEVLVDFASKELENDVTMLVIKYLGNKA